MRPPFRPAGCATLVGSQPLTDHAAATRLMLSHTPDMPTWVQLPFYKHEGMVAQFMSGLPGLRQNGERYYVDTDCGDFDNQLVEFFEDYLNVLENPDAWDDSRFVLEPGTARGFFTLLSTLQDAGGGAPMAVKGQVTGPVTFCTAVKDQEGRAIFYHDTLRDAACKMLALKAAWQVRHLSRIGAPVMISIDEPALAGFGSSEFISISREDIAACLRETIDAVHRQGGLAGVHVCANTDWSLLLQSDLDIINFDAHGYFDKFMLYAQQVRHFLDSGRILAMGLVPTALPEQIEAAGPEKLWADWREKVSRFAVLGISPDTLLAQTIVTPSCGTGSLTPELNLKVLELTRELSDRMRREPLP